MLALIDCNNFFVSCERTLNPQLQNRPVVVLSNNDGCVISWSVEAKELGIPMGAPAYKFQKVFHANGVEILFAKFELYNFRSQEVMQLAAQHSADVEIYSIDEFFLDLNGFDKYLNLTDHCISLQKLISKKVNIPVSIGLAPTKTLAKLANKLAKKSSEGHIYPLDSPESIEKALKQVELKDIWGIGRRYAVKFSDKGVHTAYDFIQMPLMWIQKQMGVLGVRMYYELKGIKQLELERAKPKKSIGVTRSFMQMLKTKEEIKERLETFAHYCAEKLRKQNSCCKRVSIFVQTNRFRDDLPQYYQDFSLVLDNPTNSSIILSQKVSEMLEKIYREGFQYKRGGVIVSEFVPDNQRLTSLFEPDTEQKHLPIMKAMDRLNEKYGKDKVRLGSTSGENTYGRKLLDEKYEEFLKHNTLPHANYRFH